MTREPLRSARAVSLCAVAVFVLSLFVYGANTGNMYAPDSAPNSLLVLNALHRHRLDFDNFKDGYLAQYIFTQTPDGHTQSIFPVGTAIVSAPIYVADYILMQLRSETPDISAIDFEPQRLAYEKQAASIIAALAAALFFLLALRFAGLRTALAGTIAFAFGSSMWTIGSQALWQHGSVALCTIALMLALVSSLRSKAITPTFLAGLIAGFMPVVRPTAIFFSLAGLAFFVSVHRLRRLPIMVIGFIVGISPGIAWNVINFHNVIGGYTVNESGYVVDAAANLHAAIGLLFSANRGLVIFTPFVLLTAFDIPALWRQSRDDARYRLLALMTLAAIATFFSYALFSRWEGGSTYGPRYLTDVTPILALLLVVALQNAAAWPIIRRRVFATAAGSLIALSVAIQAAGANGEPRTNWSGVPLDLSLSPNRIWSWHDGQIQRDALTCWRLWAPNPTFPQTYATGFNGSIGAISIDASKGRASPIVVAASTTTYITAALHNTGASRWYGYGTGIYFGQARVRLRIFDATGNEVSQDYLFFERSVDAGSNTLALGSIHLPPKPGEYELAFDIDVFQDARIGSKYIGLREIRLRVI